MYSNEQISTSLKYVSVSNENNKRKLVENYTNQIKRTKNNPYNFIITNLKDSNAKIKKNSVKRKSTTLDIEDDEYETAITSKRNLTAIIHSITESENKKTLVNNKCISCKSYTEYNLIFRDLNDGTAIHICNYTELDNLNKFYMHSYCCTNCYTRFKCRSDEQYSEKYLCDDDGVYIYSI